MTFFRKKCPFARPKFLMTFFSHRPGFSDFTFTFPRFSLSLLCYMSYMTLSSQENTLFQKIILLWHIFLLYSYFRALPTTLLLQLLGDGCMGRPPPQILGDRPPSPPRSPPLGNRCCSESVCKNNRCHASPI